MPALPLYLLPGLMCDARVWQHQSDAASKDREVRVADTSGHDSVQAIAADALAHAPAGRFALAGFSLGGYIAFEMIRQAPERVAALMLLDTGPRADTPEATDMRRRMIAALDQNSSNWDAVIGSFLPRVVHPSRVADPALIELFVAMAKVVGIAGFKRQQTASINRPDSRPTFASIAVPTLVVCGRDDQVTPLALSEEMAAGIAGAKLVTIDTCGHMAPMEQPAAVTAAMTAWLKDLPDA